MFRKRDRAMIVYYLERIISASRIEGAQGLVSIDQSLKALFECGNMQRSGQAQPLELSGDPTGN